MDVTCATGSFSPSEQIVTSPVARRLPSLSSRASAIEVARRRLAQEIDVEVDGHRQRHRADRRRAPRHTWQNRQAPSWSGRRSCRPAAANCGGTPGGPGSRAPTPLRCRARCRDGNACGNSLRRKRSSSSTVIDDRHRRPPGATELDDCGQMKRSARKATSPARGSPTPKVCPCPRSRSSGFAGACDSVPCRIACATRPWPASSSSCGRLADSCRHD